MCRWYTNGASSAVPATALDLGPVIPCTLSKTLQRFYPMFRTETPLPASPRSPQATAGKLRSPKTAKGVVKSKGSAPGKVERAGWGFVKLPACRGSQQPDQQVTEQQQLPSSPSGKTRRRARRKPQSTGKRSTAAVKTAKPPPAKAGAQSDMESQSPRIQAGFAASAAAGGSDQKQRADGESTAKDEEAQLTCMQTRRASVPPLALPLRDTSVTQSPGCNTAVCTSNAASPADADVAHMTRSQSCSSQHQGQASAIALESPASAAQCMRQRGADSASVSISADTVSTRGVQSQCQQHAALRTTCESHLIDTRSTTAAERHRVAPRQPAPHSSAALPSSSTAAAGGSRASRADRVAAMPAAVCGSPDNVFGMEQELHRIASGAFLEWLEGANLGSPVFMPAAGSAPVAALAAEHTQNSNLHGTQPGMMYEQHVHAATGTAIAQTCCTQHDAPAVCRAAAARAHPQQHATAAQSQQSVPAVQSSLAATGQRLKVTDSADKPAVAPVATEHRAGTSAISATATPVPLTRAQGVPESARWLHSSEQRSPLVELPDWRLPDGTFLHGPGHGDFTVNGTPIGPAWLPGEHDHATASAPVAVSAGLRNALRTRGERGSAMQTRSAARQAGNMLRSASEGNAGVHEAAASDGSFGVYHAVRLHAQSTGRCDAAAQHTATVQQNTGMLQGSKQGVSSAVGTATDTGLASKHQQASAQDAHDARQQAVLALLSARTSRRDRHPKTGQQRPSAPAGERRSSSAAARNLASAFNSTRPSLPLSMLEVVPSSNTSSMQPSPRLPGLKTKANGSQHVDSPQAVKSPRFETQAGVTQVARPGQHSMSLRARKPPKAGPQPESIGDGVTRSC